MGRATPFWVKKKKKKHAVKRKVSWTASTTEQRVDQTFANGTARSAVGCDHDAEEHVQTVRLGPRFA